MSDRSKPWSRRREVLLTAILFLGALGLYSLSWFRGLNGGVSTIGAERVLRGEIPYRDFWTIYAPGHYYLLALLFRMFGTHLLVETVAGSVICAAAAAVCYRLAFNLVNRRIAALACASIFVAATYMLVHKSLGTYPPAIFFVFVALNLMVLHYKTGKRGHLIAAGLATGGAVLFKHDVGIYTAIAIVAGVMAHQLVVPATSTGRARSTLLKVMFYSVGVALIVVPISIYFSVLAGPDMLQNLVIFPLTDFPLARPERYPGLFPSGIYDEYRLRMLFKVFTYVKFTLPFVLFLLGLVAIGLAVVKRRPAYVAPGVMFSVGYLLHYGAAHVQINTHIITMSVYTALLGVVCYDLTDRELVAGRHALLRMVVLILAGGWFLSLSAQPAYEAWNMRSLSGELKLPKVSGLMVSPKTSRTLTELLTFVNTHTQPDQELFVGLHRHDVVIVGGNANIYFILDRPIATRYHEIHPAVVDTADVQREIIRDLQDKNVSLIVLIRIFTDEHLEKVKSNFLRKLPQIGATDLDMFIRTNYVEVRKFDRYAIWKRKNTAVPVAGSPELHRTNNPLPPADKKNAHTRS